jgi:hypothetical protein
MGKPPNGVSAGPGKFPTPGPSSRYYVPPPSIKQLRWLIAIHLIGPGMLVFFLISSALTRDWPVLGFALVFLGSYGLLKVLIIRTILRELARRRAAVEPRES